MQRRRALLLMLALLVAQGAAAAVPDGWRLLGSGEMRWFGIKLYDARLWVPAGTPPARVEQHAFALELRYARDIAAQRLVDASIEEMQRLGDAPAERFAAWRETLATVFPDVRAGEAIIGLHHPGRGAEFFHQGRLSGRVADPDFTRRFFAIWLDPRTREPALRARLLGGS